MENGQVPTQGDAWDNHKVIYGYASKDRVKIIVDAFCDALHLMHYFEK